MAAGMSRVKRRLPVCLWSLALVLVVFITSVAPVGAYSKITPQQCDDMGPYSQPKYYCTYVYYDANVSGRQFTVLGRYYLGSRGCNYDDGGNWSCGALWWRLEYYNDWYWSGPYAIPMAAYGPSDWYYNETFFSNQPGAGWHQIGASDVMGNYVYPADYGAVLVRTHFVDCCVNGWYDWWGPPWQFTSQHDLTY